MKTKKDKENSLKSILLIIICWVVYVSTYIGKLGYTANIIQIEKYFSISHSTAGLVSTIFFFSYGIGQVLNGIFSKKLNAKYTIFICLLISSCSNLLVGITTSFNIIKIIWLINGICLSTCWPLLIKVLSTNLDEKYFPKAVIIMGTTVACGTILVYGLSALFVYLGNFKLIFYLAAILLPIIAIVWLILFNKLITNSVTKKEEKIDFVKNEKKSSLFIYTIAIFVIFAIITNLIKDGITTWMPLIIKEKYNVSDSSSILLTLSLPIISIFGTYFAVLLNKHIKNFVTIMFINYLLTTISLLNVIVFKQLNLILLILILSFISLFMSSVNNVVTSMAPIYWKDKINSGMFAGIMNGCCYLGSMLSSYFLGYIADKYNFNMVFKILILACFIVMIITIIYLIINIINNKKEINTN